MTNAIIQIALCLTAWAVVLVRFPAMFWTDAHKDNAIALKFWLMIVFIAFGLTFSLDLAASLDTSIAPNFSRLIAYCAFLIAVNLGIAASLDAVGKGNGRPLMRRMWFLLAVTLIALGVIYSLFLARLPEFAYYGTPRSLPETLFKLIDYSFETMQLVVVSRIYLDYLPSETSVLMRARVTIFIVSALAMAASWLVLMAVAAGYFLPILASPILINSSAVLITCPFVLFVIAFLNNRIYLKFVLISRSIQGWFAFQDLQYLIQRIMQLFPVIGLPPGNPNFLQFLRDPEEYLYPAVILILDGRAMLDDFIAEVSSYDEPIIELREWELEVGEDFLGEVLEVQRGLQAIDTPDDFYEMVTAYRRASRALWESAGRKQGTRRAPVQ